MHKMTIIPNTVLSLQSSCLYLIIDSTIFVLNLRRLDGPVDDDMDVDHDDYIGGGGDLYEVHAPMVEGQDFMNEDEFEGGAPPFELSSSSDEEDGWGEDVPRDEGEIAQPIPRAQTVGLWDLMVAYEMATGGLVRKL